MINYIKYKSKLMHKNNKYNKQNDTTKYIDYPVNNLMKYLCSCFIQNKNIIQKEINITTDNKYHEIKNKIHIENKYENNNEKDSDIKFQNIENTETEIDEIIL